MSSESGGKSSRRKGDRLERELRGILRRHGREFDPDLWEVKGRAFGFALIYNALENSHVCAVRRDRGDWLVALRLEDYLRETKAAAATKQEPDNVWHDNEDWESDAAESVAAGNILTVDF